MHGTRRKARNSRARAQVDLGRILPMTDTPEAVGPGADVDCGGEEVDIGLKLAGLPGEILVQLAETLGNPLALLVSKAHLSKAFCEAARNAQGLLSQADLLRWVWRVDDAVVAAVVAKCTQLSLLNLHSCGRITDVAVKAVASKCKQLTTLDLAWCSNITDEAVVAVASECKQLTTLLLWDCSITDVAVVAAASECKMLATLDFRLCRNITDEAVQAVRSHLPDTFAPYSTFEESRNVENLREIMNRYEHSFKSYAIWTGSDPTTMIDMDLGVPET